MAIAPSVLKWSLTLRIKLTFVFLFDFIFDKKRERKKKINKLAAKSHQMIFLVEMGFPKLKQTIFH